MIGFLIFAGILYFLKDILIAIFFKFPIAFIFCFFFVACVAQGTWSPGEMFATALFAAILCVIF